MAFELFSFSIFVDGFESEESWEGWMADYGVIMCFSIIISPYPWVGGYKNPKKFGKFLQFFISPTPIIYIYIYNEWRCFNNLSKKFKIFGYHYTGQ